MVGFVDEIKTSFLAAGFTVTVEVPVIPLQTKDIDLLAPAVNVSNANVVTTPFSKFKLVSDPTQALCPAFQTKSTLLYSGLLPAETDSGVPDTANVHV